MENGIGSLLWFDLVILVRFDDEVIGRLGGNSKAMSESTAKSPTSVNFADLYHG
jgi:hypothetical protein